MSIWRQVSHGIRALVQHRRADADVADEVQQYLEAATAAHVSRGLSDADARRAALVEIGNATTVREQVRSSGWEHVVEDLLVDVRYALRRLGHSAAFTVTALATLAIGIGASTAVFSAVSPILLEPLPFPNANRLVTIADRAEDGGPASPTLGTYDELRARSRSFDAMAAADRWQPSLTGTGEPERLEGQRVTASYFGIFGAHPLFGRGFDEHDDQPGAPNVVILSHALFERRFGGDRSIVGRTVLLDGMPHVVIGVLSPAFDNVIAPSAVLWAPLQARATGEFNTREWGHHYQIVGRLARGATVDGATREIRRIAATRIAEFPRPPWADMRQGLLVRPLQEDITGDISPVLLAIAGAVLLLLTIASVNVANLLLARGAQRQSEFAMRIALGAGGGRLVRQLLTESVVLAAAGGALGLLVARIGVQALVALSPAGLPRVDAIRLDARVYLFAFGVTLLVGVLVGLIPAFGASRTDPGHGLQAGTRRTTAGRTAGRSALVVAEVALALVLLVSAGLLFRSVQRLVSVDAGFNPANVVSMQVVYTEHTSDTTRLQFFTNVLDAVRHLPGVTAAAFTSQLPLSGDVDAYGYELAAFPGVMSGAGGSAFRYVVTPGYFAAMHIPLRRGRLLDDTDRPGAPEAVVINESFARRAFGNRNPIGQRARFGGESNGDHPWDVIVGVVGDVKQQSLDMAAPFAFYVASGQWQWVDNVQSLVVRTTGEPAAVVPEIKRAIWSIDANAPVQRIATMRALVAATAGARRFALVAIESFALAALVLAGVGLYGVIAGSVAERIREIGIRSALGAAPGDIVRDVVGRGLGLTVAGAIIGIAGAFATSRLLATMLFGVSRLDPATYASVLVLLIALALLASWAPARRAASVDPTTALRAD